MKVSNDGKCFFDEQNHRYHVNGIELSGVTTYISKFKNKFDIDSVAEKFAKKHGLDKLELIKKWNEEGKASIKNGTSVHFVFENYILHDKIIFNGITDKEWIASKFIDDVFKSEKLIPVHAEYLIYDEELGLASMIDCIAKNNKNEYFILDWKTNKKIDKNSYGKYMLPPYSKYPDSSFYHYSLQLSLYRKMLKDFDIKDCYIVHISDTDYSFIKYEPIDIP
jgi:ATP-dependent exoDNAse (exonuclease V) beta subunit